MTLFAVEQQERTSDDYYTPKWVFDGLAIEFDLDVCAPPGGIPWVPAKRHFTMADDGLSQEWAGRVWMNPPYSRPAPWVAKFIEHGHGIALLPFMKSQWFFDLWDRAPAMVAVGTEMSKFVAGGTIFNPTFLAAFGDECSEAIAHLGRSRR